VLDTGIGIELAEQGRIFGDFYQVANVDRDRERGMGLGLAIAQRSAQLLGGTIQVRSLPGRGSMFSVTLPAMQEPGPAPTQPAAAPAGRRRGAVLVIDDDPQLTEAMQRLLAEWGYPSITAHNVATAVAGAGNAEAHDGIGLILADYQLGGGASGIDAIRAVREHLERDVPAIIVTGNTSVEAAESASRQGHPLLHKPVDPEALLALLER